jgi:hypothetical protein
MADMENEIEEAVDAPLFAVELEVEPTSDMRVDSALARMQDVRDLPTEEHVDVFDEVHRRLQDALADSHQ